MNPLITPFEARIFLKFTHGLLREEADREVFQSAQKYLMGVGQSDGAMHFRQLKKLQDADRGLLVDMYSEFQVFSKIWLLEALRASLPSPPERAVILGGWGGLMSLLLHWLWPEVQHIESIDVDSEAIRLAHHLVEPYRQVIDVVNAEAGEFLSRFSYQSGDLVICTMCEHLPAPESLFENLPKQIWLALQGSSDPKPKDHLKPFEDMSSFRQIVDFDTTVFEGRLEWENATRWMRIGLT